MNNEQFRRLLFEDQSKKTGHDSTVAKKASPVGGDAARSKAAAFGSNMRSKIPMTPRSVIGVDFARQSADHRRESRPPPAKKFRSSAAPKGTKLAEGYQDRTLLRRAGQDEERNVEGYGSDDRGDDDPEHRVRALEDMVKLGQVDQPTFEKLREEIGVGGDVKSTHLIKGLDWKLLRRVKAGEDINAPPPSASENGVSGQPQEKVVRDIDEEFDMVLEEKEKEVKEPAQKFEKVKKGSMAPPSLDGGRRMTRDEILKKLKASRAAPEMQQHISEPPASALGERFKKIGSKSEKKRWIETNEDGRRREVLLTTDSEGKTKRKVRWLDKPDDQAQRSEDSGLLPVDKHAKPLGMDVPAEVLSRANAAVTVEEEDDDIFQGVGRDYNPLADMEDEDDHGSSSSDESDNEMKGNASPPRVDIVNDGHAQREQPLPQPAKVRDYFATSSSTREDRETVNKPSSISSDPAILAALKRAAAIRQASPVDLDDGAGLDQEATLKRKKFLEEAKRREREDAMDLDLGFGGSRFGDEDDEEAGWEAEGRCRGTKRKRGPKKKKGDKDSVNDVMKVLEGRRQGEK
ncbi:RED-like protein N-terminal region domain-containing protein [Histoplasma ohiense]|nr:RED-like protein N-terminal region domain-containing protein [Histoplasma ohiense (nom. inval.)]